MAPGEDGDDVIVLGLGVFSCGDDLSPRGMYCSDRVLGANVRAVGVLPHRV